MDNPEQRLERAIQSCCEGENIEINFRIIYDHYYHPLQRLFLRKGVPPEECRDLTQNTFEGIYKGVRYFRGEAAFETWVYEIANNAFKKWLRKRSAIKRTGTEIEIDDPTVMEPEISEDFNQLTQMLKDEQIALLAEAINELPKKMRQCLTLRVHQERSYKEISIIMRLSLETVKAHLFQARKKITAKISQGDAEIAN